MRIVIALGGNALLRRGEAPTIETQRCNVPIQSVEKTGRRAAIGIIDQAEAISVGDRGDHHPRRLREPVRPDPQGQSISATR